jgi:hypothetical protein
MPKKTLADVAKLHGITRDQLNAARSKGVNPWNEKEMAAHLKTVRHRIKPNAKLAGGTLAAKARTLEEMEAALAATQDASMTKILVAKIGGMEKAAKAQAFRRDLIPIGEVKDNIVKMVSAARAELLKLASDLPPQLAGSTAPELQKKLRAEIVAILTRLSDDCEAVY